MYTEISVGSVYIKYNSANCYGESNTNWNDIFQSPSDQKADVEIMPDRCGGVKGMQFVVCIIAILIIVLVSE